MGERGSERLRREGGAGIHHCMIADACTCAQTSMLSG